MKNTTAKAAKLGTTAGMAVIAAGAAIGIGRTDVMAENLTPQDAASPLTEAAAASVAAPITEAAVREAHADAEEAAAEAAQAQAEADAAAAKAEQADANLSNAERNAEQAFEEARTSAADADAKAEAEVTEAEQQQTNAGSAAEAAQAEAEAAKAAETAAEQTLNETRDSVTVTPEDIDSKKAEVAEAEKAAEEADKAAQAVISEKEADVTAAETAESDAQQASDKAVQASADANAAAETAQQAQAEAETAKANAEAEKTAADAAVETARANADKEAGYLQSARDLHDGKIDRNETRQGRDLTDAQNAYAEAKAQRDKDQAAADAAKTGLTDAKTAETSAQTALDDANAAAKTAADNLKAANEAKKTADAAKTAKQNDVDAKATAVSEAEADVTAKTTAKTTADTVVTTAKSASDTAAADVTTASDAANAAKTDVSDGFDSAIEAAGKTIAEKQAAADAAQTALDQAQEKYDQGMLGFIDWMLAKDGLTEGQIADLNQAKAIIEHGKQLHISDIWGDMPDKVAEIMKKNKYRNYSDMLLVPSDTCDPSSIRQISKVFQYMKDINNCIMHDDNFPNTPASVVSFTVMAAAQEANMMNYALGFNHAYSETPAYTDCNGDYHKYSAGTLYATSVECITNSNYPDWAFYTDEKERFDKAKAALGFTGALTDEQVAAIDNYAAKHGTSIGEIGHYLALFRHSGNSTIGMAATAYGNIKTYKGSRTDCQDYTYTVEEFEQLFNTYVDSIDKDKLQKAYDDANADLNSAKTAKSDLEAQKAAVLGGAEATDAVPENVKALIATWNEAKKALTAKQATAAAQLQTYNDAVTAAATAKTNLDNANKAKAAADTALANAKTQLGTAEKAVESAQALVDTRTTEKQTADAAVTAAQTKLTNAKNAVTAAQNELNAANKTLDASEKALESARITRDNAQSAFDAICGDCALTVLQEYVDAANAALDAAKTARQQAADKLSAAETALAGANAAAADAEKTAETAKAAADKAAHAYREAKIAADRARADLSLLKQDYAKAANGQTNPDMAKSPAHVKAANGQANPNAAGAAITAYAKAEAEAGRKKAELNSLEQEYSGIIAAEKALADAKQKASDAETALAEANSAVDKTKETLRAKKLAKTVTENRLMRASNLSLDRAMETPISDPEFAYLNTYVEAVKAAQAEALAAANEFDQARATLETRKLARDEAAKRYAAALADLTVLRDKKNAESSSADRTAAPAANVAFVQKAVPAAETAGQYAGLDRAAAANPNAAISGKAESEAAQAVVTPLAAPEMASETDRTETAQSGSRTTIAESVATGDSGAAPFYLFDTVSAAGLLAALVKKKKDRQAVAVKAEKKQ